MVVYVESPPLFSSRQALKLFLSQKGSKFLPEILFKYNG